MTDGKESLPEIEALSRQVAQAILKHDRVRLISHNDADGLSAAGIMCNALNRKGILFHTTIVGQFDQSTIELIQKTPDDAVILCDMGSGQVELTSQIKDAIIIDHHKPTGKLEHVHFNPHLAGIDGSTQLCAACGAYMVARQMGDNTDLAGLALTGAMGDKQVFLGANKFILDEAVENKVITVSRGLRMGDAPIDELFEFNVDPFLDITGDKEKIKEFLDRMGIQGELKNLSNEQLTKLSSKIILKLAKQGSFTAIDSMIGDNYTLNREVVPNIYDLVNIMNACGKDEVPGIALMLCMRDSSVVDKARTIVRENQRDLISAIRKAQTELKSVRSFRYVLLGDSSGTGIISGTMTRYLHPDRPFLTFNEVEGKIRISGRGTRKQVNAGLDLASAMREASTRVGGMGGGHDIASGATIPVGTAMKFIDIIDSIIEKQLRSKA
ncbi:MAG: DHH family phosphoesterase [Candidatus Methanoperedens sp.]|nr:DHH family phosphoesterase [Candidatus Methanoperedens sp.]